MFGKSLDHHGIDSLNISLYMSGCCTAWCVQSGRNTKAVVNTLIQSRLLGSLSHGLHLL